VYYLSAGENRDGKAFDLLQYEEEKDDAFEQVKISDAC
jgi:hypothetical protein